MLTESDIQSAVDFLHHKAGEAAEARAQHEFLDGMTKTVLAGIASKSNESSQAARESWARQHPDFLVHLEGLKAAAAKDYEFRMKREAATAKLDAWRTQEASRRGADRAG